MSTNGKSRLQSTRRLVPSDKRKRALFSCDRCKLRKTKCKRIQNNDLKYDNITPCIQCSKAGVSCTTSIPRKKRFYGPVKNISLHYKCLLALITGLFPDSDVYDIEELINLGHKLKFEMPNLDFSDETLDKSEQESFEKLKRETKNLENSNSNSNLNSIKQENEVWDNEHNTEKNKIKENINLKSNSSNDEIIEINSVFEKSKKFKESEKKLLTNYNNTKSHEKDSIKEKSNILLKLPPGVKLKHNNIDSERLIMDKFGHTHFIGNFGTASLLNGLCDIIIKRSYNQKNPPTSTQDIRDSSVQTITSENAPVYQYPTHLYNSDAINIDRFPLINIIERNEADVYVKVFFEKVHPYYFIFDKNSFFENYELFWEELGVNASNENKSHTISRLSSAEICTIYTVWILGRRFQQYSDPENLPPNSILDEELIGKFIDIIKLSLSDIVLTPSIDGIRLLILFSVYLSSIKIRESGYCLMELAAIQAKSLGLHRKSIVNKFNDQKSDVMKRILWSLTKAETTLCCSFGRASAIPWEEIDIDFPDIEDESDEHFKIFYLQSCNLTKIIFEILDYKKKTQRDPLSLISIDKALYFKKKLEKFWDNLPLSWKDYKSLPIKRYKPKLHIQYHYYFITLTLPMFLHLVNSHNYKVKNDDPFLSLLVFGIRSSFATAEITSYTDSKGFFNGTIYYDVFYCYNAIMVLTLSYILFKSQHSKSNQIIDLTNLNLKYDINLEEILKSIHLIRKLVLNNLHKIDGTMRRMSDIIETLLEDLGIIQTLVTKYNAPSSNVKNIETKDESGNTSVTSIPTGYRRLNIHLNKRFETNKRKRNNNKNNNQINLNKTSNSGSLIIDNADLTFNKSKENNETNTPKMKRAKSHPIESIVINHDKNDKDNNNHNNILNEKDIDLINNITEKENINDSISLDFGNLSNKMNHSYSTNSKIPDNILNPPLTPFLHSLENSSTNLFLQGFNHNSNNITNTNNNINNCNNNIPNENENKNNKNEKRIIDHIDEFPILDTDINDVLSSMSLNTDLMDALFGTDLLNLDQNSVNFL